MDGLYWIRIMEGRIEMGHINSGKKFQIQIVCCVGTLKLKFLIVD
jgi:hypothetical protein